MIEHTPNHGKKTFGYSLFLGRDENGKQLREVRRGFACKADAAAALRAAIEQSQGASRRLLLPPRPWSVPS
jgi:hypothetical protein